VWATGFRTDYSWLDVPGVIVDGQVRHHDGVTQVPGLYFLGLPWQTSRGSALLGFVGVDAAVLSAQMIGDVATSQKPPVLRAGSELQARGRGTPHATFRSQS
jgi:putative flavoprotein involved in K+ transport